MSNARLKSKGGLEARGSVYRDGKNVPETSYCCLSMGKGSPERKLERLQGLRLREPDEAGCQARLSRMRLSASLFSSPRTPTDKNYQA